VHRYLCDVMGCDVLRGLEPRALPFARHRIAGLTAGYAVRARFPDGYLLPLCHVRRSIE
jgi:hypothetical protein